MWDSRQTGSKKRVLKIANGKDRSRSTVLFCTFIVSLHFPPKAHNQTRNWLLFTPTLILFLFA